MSYLNKIKVVIISLHKNEFKVQYKFYKYAAFK